MTINGLDNKLLHKGDSSRGNRPGEDRYTVSIDDSHAFSSRQSPGQNSIDQKLFIDKCDLTPPAIHKVLLRMVAIDPNYGKDGQGLKASIQAVAKDVDGRVAEALKIAYHGYRRLQIGKSPSLTTPSEPNAQKALQAALCTLNQIYGRTLEYVTEGDKNSPTVTLRAPGVTVSRPLETLEKTDRPAGTQEVRAKGVKVGDKVFCELPRVEGVVTKATHEHGGFGKGPERIEVKDLATGQKHLVTPLYTHPIDDKPFISPIKPLSFQVTDPDIAAWLKNLQFDGHGPSQQALLGAILSDPETVFARAQVKPDDFCPQDNDFNCAAVTLVHLRRSLGLPFGDKRDDQEELRQAALQLGITTEGGVEIEDYISALQRLSAAIPGSRFAQGMHNIEPGPIVEAVNALGLSGAEKNAELHRRLQPQIEEHIENLRKRLGDGWTIVMQMREKDACGHIVLLQGISKEGHLIVADSLYGRQTVVPKEQLATVSGYGDKFACLWWGLKLP